MRGTASAAALALAVAAGGAPAAAPLRFDRVFATAGEPPALHFRASYLSQGTSHRLELWRDGERRLVRRTDDAVETHVAKTPGEAGYRMVVLDLRRRIETRVTRDDLYRIGHFTDWFDLAHGLRTPLGDHRLTAVPPADAPALATVVPCRWYRLEQGARTTRICWSERDRLPIAMLDGAETRPLWQVEHLDRRPAPAGVFEVRDDGYVRNDASRDISGD